MLAKKSKQKPEAPAAEKQSWTGQLRVKADKAMQQLFQLPEGWHKERDIVKNNMELGIRHYRLSHGRDAFFRFKVATWFGAGHADAWYYLGRTCLALGKRQAGITALKKAVVLSHAEAAAVLAVAEAKAPAIALKEAGADQAAALAKLHEDSFLTSWKEKEIADMLAIAGTKAWIAGTETLAMGMMIGRALAEQYEILTIVVMPEWRGRGIAKQLLAHAIAEAKQGGAKTMFLEVAEDNFSARGFYEQAGFTLVNRRKDYYRQPDGGFTDALVMRLEIA